MVSSLYLFIIISCAKVSGSSLLNSDTSGFWKESLSPYIFKHGSHLSHREIRDCHKNEYGTLPHELYFAHQSINATEPFIQIKRFVKTVSNRIIRGHQVQILNPLKTLSVLEPNQSGGCSLNIRQTTKSTSKKGNCILSMNAGYFDTKKGTCYGNVVSDGRKAHDAKGIQNAHFGLTSDGQIFTGFLSEEEYDSGGFEQLVGGVIWILRNGTGYVNTSKVIECEDSQETGTMDQFVNILSARTVVGHDKDGSVILVQVDGKSGIDGINLYELESLLKEFGLINAINLDGGGSSTLVIDGVTTNYPYDSCPDEKFACDREVSTILCVHEPFCKPKDCSNHGLCSFGECVCEKNWLPPRCDELFCGFDNCSKHGICLPSGCICNPGYYGENCDKVCDDGWYGVTCSQPCNCVNADSCDPVTGTCNCKPGFTGERCESQCPVGLFGLKCASSCMCENGCFCNPFNGSCDISRNSSLYQAGKCLANKIIHEQHLVKDDSDEKRKWLISVIVLGVITSLCLTSFLLVLFCSCSCHCRNEQVLCIKNSRKKFRKLPLQIPSGDLSDSFSDSDNIFLKNLQKD